MEAEGAASDIEDAKKQQAANDFLRSASWRG
jgi:hypothetical protein